MNCPLLFLLLCASASAAEWTLPAANQGQWTPGTNLGITGGLAQYIAGGANDRAVTGTVIDITASPYFAASNNNQTTGSITSGAAALTVASPTGFTAGNYITIGMPAIHTLTVTGAATATANLRLAIGIPGGHTILLVPLVSGDTTAQVATKIRAATVAHGRITTSGSGNDVIFTSPNAADVYVSAVQDYYYNTGVTGSFAVTQAGTAYSHRISSVAGNVLTLTANAAASLTNALVQQNVQPAVVAAVSAMADGDVIYFPAGEYRFGAGYIYSLYLDGRTFRGAPNDATTWHISHPETTFLFSAPGGTGNNVQTVTGTKTKGTATLAIPNTTDYTVGSFVRVDYENEVDNARIQAGAPPTWNSVGYPFLRSYVHKITAVVANTSISIDPPLPHNGTDVEVRTHLYAFNTTTARWGFEDIVVNIDEANKPPYVINFNNADECWLHNVKFPNWTRETAAGSCVGIFDSYRCEVRKCVFDIETGADSDGAIGTGTSTSCLYEDNILSGPWDITIYDNGGALNCVSSYNFSNASRGSYFHNAHPSLNLFEGNCVAGHQSDGYHGSSSNNTFFRNWNKGPFPLTLNRFKRQYVAAGNIFGTDGSQAGGISWGNPNIGNGQAEGFAGPTGLSDQAGELDYLQLGYGVYEYEILPGDISAGDFWQDWKITATLTTRTSDTVGVFTVSHGNFFTGGNNIGATLYISAWWGPTVATFITNGTVTAVAGSAVTVSFASGSLPAAATPNIRLYLGTSSWQERDLDVQASSTLASNYTASAGGTGSLTNSIAPDTLPNSLMYAAKPAFFRSLEWPAFNPNDYAGTADPERIPAGYRFYNAGADPPPDGPDVTAPTLVSSTINAAGTTITFAFSEAVTPGAGGNAGWTLSLSSGSSLATYSSGSGTSSLVYTLSSTVNSGTTGTAAYTQPGNGWEDGAGNDLATLSGATITNNSTQGSESYDASKRSKTRAGRVRPLLR